MSGMRAGHLLFYAFATFLLGSLALTVPGFARWCTPIFSFDPGAG